MLKRISPYLTSRGKQRYHGLARGASILSKLRPENKAQTILEYVTLIGIITVVMVTITPYLKRSVQSVVKVTADQMGVQNAADQTDPKVDQKSSYIVEAFTSTKVSNDKQLREIPGGKTQYIYGDRTESISNSLQNLGFTNRSY